MTQKHQLKTIPCITYYFMLGWNLSACINSLYKLRLAGSGQPPCWGKISVVVVLLDGGCCQCQRHCGRGAGSLGSCPGNG